MLSPTQITALAAAEQQASVCEQRTGCPKALTIAQWALESGWGKYAPGNNCFGIKVYGGCFGIQKLATHEYVAGKPEAQNLCFATFRTLEDCFEKHALLITAGYRYASAFTRYKLSRDVEQLVKDIAPVYAPGNTTYADSVLAILHMTSIAAWLNGAD